MPKNTLARAVCALLALGAGPAYAQAKYSVADVGAEVSPPYTWHLNAAGQFTGYLPPASPGSVATTAVFWDGSTLHHLLPPLSSSSSGHTLNDLGQVVVSSERGLFIWTAGSYRQIAPPRSGFHPLAMNDAGLIAGFWQIYTHPADPSPARAMAWNGSSLQFLAGPFSSAYDVNEAGQIAGSWNTTPPTATSPALWTDFVLRILSFADGPAYGAMHDVNDSGQAIGHSDTPLRWNGVALERLGTLGGWTDIRSINDSGQAVGTAATTSMSRGRAVVWNGTAPTEIGAPDDSHGYAINASGTVVGWYAIPPAPEGGGIYVYHAFVRDRSLRTLDEAIDPADPLRGAVHLTMAWDINDAGQILATGHVAGQPSARRTFVLTPTSPNPFGGLLPPLRDAPALNVVKAGSAVPVKFRLGGNHGPDVLATGYPRFVPTDCGTGLVTGEPSPIATPGSSGLSYDPAGDAYTYVWKTDRAIAGTCGRLDVVFDDGAATRSATFRFR